MDWIEPDLEEVLGQLNRYRQKTAKEEEMELTWKGYMISLRVQRKDVGTPDPKTKQISRPPLPQHRQEEVERHYLLAAGNRYVAPTR